MKEKILKELESRSSWTLSCNFWKKIYSCHENNRLLSDGYKGQVFDKPCFHKSLCKKRPTDDSRCHILPLTENNLCLVVFNLSIFSRIAKIRIFWREIGTAALKPQKLAVRCSQDFVEHTTSQWSIAPEYFHLYILARFQRWIRRRIGQNTLKLCTFTKALNQLSQLPGKQNENRKYCTSDYRDGSS